MGQLLTFAVISTGVGPTAHCLRCTPGTSTALRPAVDILNDARSAVSEWDHLGPGPNLALHGPDLFLHPEFREIVTGLAHIDAERICVATAGLGGSDLALVGLLAHSGITHIHIALHADNAQAHDALTGHSGAFDQARARADSFRAHSTALGLPPLLCGDIPVCRHNLALAPGIVALLAAQGVQAITLDTSNAPGTASARAWIDAALDTGIVSGAWVCETTGGARCAHAQVFGRSPVSLVGQATP